MKRITNTYKVTKMSKSMGNSSITSVYSSEEGDYCLKQEAAKPPLIGGNEVSMQAPKKSKGKKKKKKIMRKVATQKELDKPTGLVAWQGQIKPY